MYRILIVDDEKLLRQGIISLTNWIDHGYMIIAEAANGVEAMDIIEVSQPDIVITDIVMPVMNGVELVKKIRECYKDIQVIVLSSYSEFDYVRETLKLGAVDYILKQEIGLEGLLKVLEKVRLIIDEKHTNNSQNNAFNIGIIYENLFQSLLTDSSQYRASFRNHMDKYNISLSDENLQLIIFCPRSLSPWSGLKSKSIPKDFRNNILLQFSDILNLYSFFSSESILTLLMNIPPDSESELKDAAFRAINTIFSTYGLDYIAVLSEIFNGIEQTRSIYFKTLKISQFSFYDKDKCVLKYQEYRDRTSIPSIDYKQIGNMMDALDFDGIYDSVENQINLTLEKRLYFETYELKKTLVEVFNYIVFRLTELGFDLCSLKNSRFEYIKNLEYSTSLTDLLNEFLAAVKALESEVVNAREKYSALVSQVISYINSNFTDEISLSSAATRFHINKSYLCKVFKQNTGENFSNYLIKVRIDKAKRLLRETDLSVSSIGGMVGYPNSSYFVQVFKKSTDFTPLEYSKRIRK